MKAKGYRAWLLSAAFGLGSGFGCVLDLSDDDPDDSACADVSCSLNGYCRDGECLCANGFLGNPYALYGCQSTRPGLGCTTTCGLNAYCDNGACVCDEGFVAMCGTGDCLALRQVCDGLPDCPNWADEAPETCAQTEIQQWTLTDDCADGRDIEWKLWSTERDWAWPGADAVFVTDGRNWPNHEQIECLRGERICFGAAAGEHSWGVGLDATGQCEDCCFRCLSDAVDLGAMTCE